MTIKRFMICLSLAIATMGFTACNSGDDDEPGNIPGQGNGQGGNIGFTPERIVDVSQAGTLPEKISEVDMYKIKACSTERISCFCVRWPAEMNRAMQPAAS